MLFASWIQAIIYFEETFGGHMNKLSSEIGKRIKNFRKKRMLTIESLAQMICKSKATVSKYEKGEIILDIVTLYDLATALQIHVEQLLYTRSERTIITNNEKKRIFNGLSQFFSYVFDGRSNQILKCVFDVLSEAGNSRYKIMMYMNFNNYENYQNC